MDTNDSFKQRVLCEWISQFDEVGVNLAVGDFCKSVEAYLIGQCLGDALLAMITYLTRSKYCLPSPDTRLPSMRQGSRGVPFAWRAGIFAVTLSWRTSSMCCVFVPSMPKVSRLSSLPSALTSGRMRCRMYFASCPALRPQ